MINTSNIQQAKEQIKKEKHPAVVKSQNPDFDRKILEYGKADILLFDKLGYRQDRLKQIDSGLNHVLAKIAAKNNTSIGFDLAGLRKSSRKTKALILLKLIENIKICKKANCRIVLISQKNKKDAQNLMLSLGASTQQAKQAITF